MASSVTQDDVNNWSVRMRMSSKKPVIVIAGLGCESSAFSPARTEAAAFHPRRGDEIIDANDFLQEGTDLRAAATWYGALTGHALPGGIVTRSGFEALAAEIVERLQRIKHQTAIDGLWYDIHGAMTVEGLDDAETELLRRIRAVVGKSVVVSASMDLHGNVSRDLVHQTDLITVYRTAPHIDETETKHRACRNLVKVLIEHPGGTASTGAPVLPLKAWIPVPVLLAGEQTSTRVEPAKYIYDTVPQIEALPEVLDVGVWIGYAWADEPRNRAAVVVTGWDRQTVERSAERIANLLWDAHAEFDFVAPTGTLEEAVNAALDSKVNPYFISDSGDNPTAGGAGDVTWTLQQLLNRPEFKDASGPKLIYASIPTGGRVINTIQEAGIGATVSLSNVGAQTDNLHAPPLTLKGKISAIKTGDPDAVTEAVLQVGSLSIILTELRKPYHHEHDFTDLGLQPRRADVVVVKIGYLEPELYEMAADWMMALTPGGVDQNLEGLEYKRIMRPMWPFDRVWRSRPDLGARIVPPPTCSLDVEDGREN